MSCQYGNLKGAKVVFLAVALMVAVVFVGLSVKRYQRAASLRQSTEVVETRAVETRISNPATITINMGTDASDPMLYVFQILFWLFFISPPVIVVLLLVIIKKLSEKNSMK